MGSAASTGTLEAVKLLETIVIGAAKYPSFEREVVQPVIGKLAVNLQAILERTAEAEDWHSCVSEG